MDYKIPDNIKTLCEKQDLSDDKEQDLVKNEVIKYATQYLDKRKGKNSIINITDVVRDFFKIRGGNYPFERDIARRMARTRDYEIREGKNKNNDDEVYIIPLDRKLWEKYTPGWTVLMLLVGAAIPLLFHELPKLWQKPKLNARIEKRGPHITYLVNTSASKIFQFTVKITRIKDDSIFDYKTRIISLGPGDEQNLEPHDDTDSSTSLAYPMITHNKMKIYLLVPPSIKESPISNDVFMLGMRESVDTVIGKQEALISFIHKFSSITKDEGKFSDSIIDGKTAKYKWFTYEEPDSLHPYPSHTYKYEFKVTGGIEINASDWIKNSK